MRILIASLGILFLISDFVLGNYGVGVFESVSIAEHPGVVQLALVVLLSFCIFFEAVLLLGRGLQQSTAEGVCKQSPSDDEPSLRTKISKLEDELSKADTLLSNLKRARDEGAQKVRALEASLANLHKKQSSSAKRDDLIDAEIVNLLSLLQEKGRLVDFVMDDITPYDDSQVGAAARVVHQGCRAVLEEYFDIAAIHNSPEGEEVALEEGFDSTQFRLVGKVGDRPPYRGRLMHKGWQTRKISLPRVVKSDAKAVSHDVISPAEVEIG